MENHKNKGSLSKIERLEKRKAEIAEEIKRERTKANKEKRRWENNQKIRVGAAIINEFKGKPAKMAELLQLLDSFYPNDYDRKYFVEWGLPPHSKNAPAPSENEGGQ